MLNKQNIVKISRVKSGVDIVLETFDRLESVEMKRRRSPPQSPGSGSRSVIG